MPQSTECISGICCSPRLISSVEFMMLFHPKYNFRKHKVLEVKNKLRASSRFCSTRCYVTISCPVLLELRAVDPISAVLRQ